MKNNFCYIHIPFCTSKCSYCRFASFGTIDKIKIDFYVKYLLNEIEKSPLVKTKEGVFLNSIYFGGGTPSTLSLENFEEIFNKLREKYIFDETTEINIEATPATITKQNLFSWKKLGINRISMGVQTLNEKSLKEIGRDEKGDIINALENIKEVGFENISIDFIIGLPYVAKGEITRDIKYLLDKYDFIKHISVYMLEEYYDVPEEKYSKFDNVVYPDNWSQAGIKEDDYLGEYLEINTFLNSNGFNRYEISNYSKPGYECKHNKAYWNHSEVLAFGLGAHGFLTSAQPSTFKGDGFKAIRYSNSEEFKKYYAGELDFKEYLEEKDLFLESVMFSLRTSGLTKKQLEKLDINKINSFLDEGYLEEKKDKISITNKGVLLMDYILSEII